MYAGLTIVAIAIAWSLFCHVVDGASSRDLSQEESKQTDTRITIKPNPWQTPVVAAIIGAVLGNVAPEHHGITAAIIVVTMINVSHADWRNSLIWEEISIPTLLAVLGSETFSGNALSSAEGASIVGGSFCVLFFLSAMIGKRTGTGDLLPIATLGAAFGPVGGMLAFGVSSVAVLMVYPFVRRRGKEIPMGPGLAVGSIAGVILEQFLPKI